MSGRWCGKDGDDNAHAHRWTKFVGDTTEGWPVHLPSPGEGIISPILAGQRLPQVALGTTVLVPEGPMLKQCSMETHDTSGDGFPHEPESLPLSNKQLIPSWADW